MNKPPSKSEPPDADVPAAPGMLPSPAAILARIVKKWYWCALSLCICLPLAYLYASRLPFVYGKATTVIIKTDYPRESVATTVLATSNGIVNMAETNLDNEIFLLSSRSLMEKIVRALTLNVTYWKKNGFRKEEIYNRTPVSVHFREGEDSADTGFRVIPVSGTEFSLKSGVDEPHPERKNGRFGEETEFLDHKFTVEKTALFSTASLHQPVIVRKTSVKKAALALSGGLTVKKASGKTNLVNISVRSNNPYKSADVLNSVVLFYNDAARNEKKERGERTNTFIDGRLDVLNNEMDQNDRDIETLKKENDILTDIQTALTEEYENILSDKKDLRELELEIKSIEYLKDYLAEEAEYDTRLVPINSKIADIGIRDQISVFNDTLLRRTRLKVNAGPNNPIVKELEANLLTLKDALRRSVDNYYSALIVRSGNVQKQYEKTREHILKVSGQESEINRINRELRVRESNYIFLLNKREENSLALAAPEDNARIVDAVRGGDGPVAPNVLKILFVGLLAGFAIPVALCVVAAAMDTSVKNRKELEALTRVPVYGIVPRKPKKMKDREIVVEADDLSELSESFPMLAEQMVSLANETGRHGLVVLLTSTRPEEGKTYVALNLSLSLAMAGKKVLLIDTDLRRGSLSTLLGGERRPGLGDLADGGDWHSMVVPSPEAAHLDYLFAGTLPAHPSRVLLHERLRAAVEEMRGDYDFIFLDGIPFPTFADAHIAARLADATIYVMRAGYLKKRDLPPLHKVVKRGELPRAGIVLTDSECPICPFRKRFLSKTFKAISRKHPARDGKPGPS